MCSSPLPLSVQMGKLCTYTAGKGQSLTFAVSSVRGDSLCVRINERGQDGRRTSLRETQNHMEMFIQLIYVLIIDGSQQAYPSIAFKNADKSKSLTHVS